MYSDFRITVARDLEAVEAMRSNWLGLLNECQLPAVDAHIDRYISVIESNGKNAEPYVIRVAHPHQGDTIAVCRIEDGRLPCRIGYRNMLNLRARLIIIDGMGILGECDESAMSVVYAELFSALKAGLADAILFNFFRVGAEPYRVLLSSLGRGLSHCAAKGPHFYMTIPADLKGFYDSQSRQRTRTLRRQVRKLYNEFKDQIKIVTYRAESDLDAGLKDASAVSRNSYKDALGVGLADDSKDRTMLETAARNGWLRLSVMYVKDEPCAYQLGLACYGTYLLERSAFANEWRPWNVGTVLFIQILEQLCDDPEVRLIDFGFGDAEYKRSYGNMEWQEVSMYVFAKRLRPCLSAGIYLGIGAVDSLVRALAVRLGIANTVRGLWRRRLEKTGKSPSLTDGRRGSEHE